MLRDRLRNLFSAYPNAIRQIVAEVVDLEQQYISREKPRLGSQIDEIVSRVAKQELEKKGSQLDDPASET